MPTKMKTVNQIIARIGLQDEGPIQAFFTSTCAKAMDKYVPYNEGTLAKYTIEDDQYIVYNQPYAHYMYVGQVMGPNIPIKEDGIIVGWFSKKPKHYTGKQIDYSKSIARGHKYAGPQWDKRMWNAEKDKIIEQVQNKIGGI